MLKKERSTAREENFNEYQTFEIAVNANQAEDFQSGINPDQSMYKSSSEATNNSHICP